MISILVDGNWGEWSNYGDCDKTCGTSKKKRTRECNNPAKANGGMDCIGSEFEYTACITDQCPGANAFIFESDHIIFPDIKNSNHIMNH